MVPPLDRNRLRRHSTLTLVALPDDDPGRESRPEALAVLDTLGRLLLSVLLWEAQGDAGRHQLRPPIRDGTAAGAVERLAAALTLAYSGPAPGPVAPDGATTPVALRWARVERADVATLAHTARALGAVDCPEILTDLLSAENRGQAPADLISGFARLHGLLELPWDDDVEQLSALLPAGQTAQVRLSAADADAYRRLTGRIVAIWHAGNPLASWLYRCPAQE